MKKDLAPLERVLRGPSLKALWQQGEQQQQLNEIIRSQLPLELQKHLTGSRLDQASLTLSWSSSAAASAARFRAPSLGAALRQTPCQNVSSIVMQVRPAPPQRMAQVRHRNLPGVEALSHLEQTLTHCSAHEIRDSLERLCETLRTKQQQRVFPDGPISHPGQQRR